MAINKRLIKSNDEGGVVPAESFNTVLYTGNGANTDGGKVVTGVGFVPELMWVKNRDNSGENWVATDVVSGFGKILYPNLTLQQGGSDDAYFSENSDGFDVNTNNQNLSGNDYVAFCWKAGGAAVTNTDGSITSTVSANPDAGFSIVKYTAGGTANVGHGLSQAPELIINKSLDGALNWVIYSADVGTQNFGLFTTAAFSGNSGTWSAVDADTFTTNINSTSYSYINYCFHSVDGYQKVGSYEGSTSAVTVNTGFEPRFVLVKNVDALGNWTLWDSIRGGTNFLQPNNSGAEASGRTLTFNSDGFTINTDAGVNGNSNGDTFIYLAIA